MPSTGLPGACPARLRGGGHHPGRVRRASATSGAIRSGARDAARVPVGIARNLALKHWRKEHRFESLDDEDIVAEPFDFDRGDVGEIVGRAVRALRPLQREVVILAEYKA